MNKKEEMMMGGNSRSPAHVSTLQCEGASNAAKEQSTKSHQNSAITPHPHCGVMHPLPHGTQGICFDELAALTLDAVVPSTAIPPAQSTYLETTHSRTPPETKFLDEHILGGVVQKEPDCASPKALTHWRCFMTARIAPRGLETAVGKQDVRQPPFSCSAHLPPCD